jgi:hypothetical protein
LGIALRSTYGVTSQPWQETEGRNCRGGDGEEELLHGINVLAMVRHVVARQDWPHRAGEAV